MPGMTASELIDALGGNRAVAEIAGVLSSAVSNWRKFGRIPPRLFITIRDAARDRGVEVPENLFEETPDPRRREVAAPKLGDDVRDTPEAA